ncbi:uncharacterized protein LOC130046463 [Ostrea edulis]|uniref:uncharacterized protein LOC130046463 n=1 Tax=Ostrea edulis TaxID=37623 RepID=UPI0024AF9BC7|nr:uncharacterized protein LOC130046463 [Ostrea edulis]
MHLQKCFKYAFAKNQGDAKGLEENLRAIVPHQFGDHSLCDSKFCGFKRSPDQAYSHKSLPYKTALKDDEMRFKLDEIFSTVIANSEQFAELGSSQQCEHANREVTLRVPKSLHYGNSEALDFRVAATTAFINEGREYITKVNQDAGISPGKFTKAYADDQMKRRKHSQEKSKLSSTKRRRLILKQERVITQGANEVLEGASYQSDIALDSNLDVEQLPEAVPSGNFKAVSIPENSTFVAFDLETTDLVCEFILLFEFVVKIAISFFGITVRGGRMPHITQIAAKTIGTNDSFSAYVIPKMPISSAAQDITGIVYNNSGTMTVRGKHVEPKTLSSAVTKLCDWLAQYPHVFLVAHNGKTFDYPVFLSALSSIGSVGRFMDCVIGLIDSLAVFKKKYPRLSSYKQEELAKSLLNATYGAHDAEEDVNILVDLVSHSKMTEKELSTFSFPPSAVCNQLKYNKMKASNLPSLHPLIGKGVFRITIAEKIAAADLSFDISQIPVDENS